MKQSIGSGRGSVYNIIMKALQSGDKYGYEICQEIERKTNGKYILKQPSLYSGLKRLEAQKLVESYWGDSDIGGRRHYYKLTLAGQEKIEKSGFSWEDERESIIDTFFKKSELDENLGNIQKEIDSAKDEVIDAQKTNEQINNVISTTSDVSKNQESKTFGHKVSDDQFDLFSFSSLSISNSNTEQKSEEASKVEELLTTENKEQDFQSTTQISMFDKNVETDTEKAEITEQTKTDDNFNFEEFFKAKQQKSFAETKEAISSAPINIEDLEKSSLFYGSNNFNNEEYDKKETNDEFEKRFKQFQDSFQDEEKKEQLTNTQEDEEKIRNQQELRMSEILSNETNIENKELKFIFDSERKESVENQNISNENTENNADEITQLNLKSIFGDLFDDSENKEELEKKRQEFLDNNFNSSSKETEVVKQEMSGATNEVSQDILPRYDISDNINLSLSKNQYAERNVEPHHTDTSNFDFSSQIHNTDNYNIEHKNFTPKATISFDKKCSNSGYNFSDYEIRYLRQNNISDKATNYIKVGKLSFFASMTISCLSLLATLLFYFLIPQTINSFYSQKLCFVLAIILTGLYITYNLVIYVQNKNRRGQYEFSTKNFIFNLTISLFAVGIIAGLNSLLGLKINNLNNYVFSFVVPVIMVVCVLVKPLIMTLLNKLVFNHK